MMNQCTKKELNDITTIIDSFIINENENNLKDKLTQHKTLNMVKIN